MTVGLIWAQARGVAGRGAIGRDGDMPWHLPEDLAHFKAVTLGAPVIMGRRTWESLPARFRPLPGRTNVVVTRAAGYAADGARTAASLEDALALARSDAGAAAAAGRIWVIGGGELYRAAMPFAAELAVTRIELDVPDADTFSPEIGPEWRLVDPGEALVAANGLAYRFERYRR